METISVTKPSPPAILVAASGLSLSIFLLVILFKPQLYITLDVASYLVFHNIAEIFSVIVSLSIFGVGWFTYDQSKNQHTLFLSCAFLAIGLMDFLHTLSYTGMPAFITPNSPLKSTQFWIAVRTYSALVFLVSGYVHPESSGRLLSRDFLLASAIAVSGVVFVGVVYFPTHLPVTIIEGRGVTPFKMYSEYFIMFLFALAIPAYWKRYVNTGSEPFTYYMAAFIICILSEFVFSGYKSVFDTYNVLGHIYKIIAFSLIYWGIFIAAVKFPYFEMVSKSDELKAESGERKQAEKATKESEDKYRALLETSTDIILTHDITGRITYINPSGLKITEYCEADLIGSIISGILPPEERVEMEKRASARRRGEVGTYEYETKFISKSGKKVSVEVHSAPIIREGQGPEFLINARDITERKRAEETLNARNSDLNYLNKAAIELASLQTDHEMFSFVTSRLKEYSGASVATLGVYDSQTHEIQVKYELIDEQILNDFIKPFGGRKLVDARFPVTDEVRMDLLQNPVRFVPTFSQVTFGVVPPEAGHRAQTAMGMDRFIGMAYVVDNEMYGTTVLGLHKDVHDPSLEILNLFANMVAVSLKRRRVEEALSASEKRFRAIIEHAPDGFTLNNAQGLIEYASPAVGRMLGYDPAEVTGLNPSNLTHPDDLPTLMPQLIDLIQQPRKVITAQYRFRHKDGSWRWLESTISNMLDEPSVQALVFNYRDITERKRAVEEIKILNTELEARVIQRTAQVESANKELEAFAYSVSHDLRAPLRAITGYTNILLEDYEPSFDAEGKRLCGIIIGEAQRMGKLIDDLLTFSRLSRTEMRDSKIDMQAMAQSVFDELTLPESREKIDLQVGELPAAMGDPGLIRQVWVNLISNALKFTSKKERAVIEVGCKKGSDETIYFVRDNGAGFDMQYAGKLFGVFQRLHSEREFEGTGVGLAIVQRVVFRHGGRVWGEGQVDKGAAFYFTLPGKEVSHE